MTNFRLYVMVIVHHGLSLLFGQQTSLQAIADAVAVARLGMNRDTCMWETIFNAFGEFISDAVRVLDRHEGIYFNVEINEANIPGLPCAQLVETMYNRLMGHDHVSYQGFLIGRELRIHKIPYRLK